jgi:hypothetical protein
MPWMCSASEENRTKALLIFREGDQMTRGDDIMGKEFWRQMKEWQYNTRYWTIPAWKHGGGA